MVPLKQCCVLTFLGTRCRRWCREAALPSSQEAAAPNLRPGRPEPLSDGVQESQRKQTPTCVQRFKTQNWNKISEQSASLTLTTLLLDKAFLTEDDERQLQPDDGQSVEQEGRDDASDVAQGGTNGHAQVPAGEKTTHTLPSSPSTSVWDAAVENSRRSRKSFDLATYFAVKFKLRWICRF